MTFTEFNIEKTSKNEKKLSRDIQNVIGSLENRLSKATVLLVETR